MERNWKHIEGYLETLRSQVYDEPITRNHARITAKSFTRFVLPYKDKIQSALDVGCGQAVALRHFAKAGVPVIGITLSEVDAEVCRKRGFDVRVMDQSFLDFPDGHFDLVWSRHCLEHSPMPLLTLFEYARVLRPAGLVYIEVPQPDSIHLGNPNHYSLFSDRGWRNLFKRAKLELRGYCTYPLSYDFRNWKAPGGALAFDDYYYAYLLVK